MKKHSQAPFTDPTLQGNVAIKSAIHQFHLENTDQAYLSACAAIRERMVQDGHFIFPADTTEDCGRTGFLFRTLDVAGSAFVVAFTDQEAFAKAPPSDALSYFISSMLETIMQQEAIAGLLINPWGEQFILCKADIGMILDGSALQIAGASLSTS